jgi:cytochrome c oxidase assembly factor CtaG
MVSHLHHGASESFWVSSVLIFGAFLYVRGWLGVWRQDHGNVEGWRAGSFVLGLLFVWIAMASPLAALDHEMLTVHMAQHLLLMTLAPPLILLGMPRKVLVHGVLQRVLTMGRPLRSPARQPLGSALTRPALCWLAAAGTLVVWHIPWVFTQVLGSPAWHWIEQASFLAAGLLFWWPVVEPSTSASGWSEWSILLYLFLATLPCDILSGFLVFSDRVVYPVFLSSHQAFGLSALEDQQCAGALMWTCVTVVYLIAAAIYAAHLLSPHRSEQRSVPQFELERIALSNAHSQKLEVV